MRYALVLLSMLFCTATAALAQVSVGVGIGVPGVPRLAATGVDSEYRGREKASDHAPVWVQL